MTWWNEDVEPKKDFELIPTGQYLAALDDASLDATVSPNKLSLTYKLLDGDHKNRLLWQNFTLNQKSAKWISWQLGALGAHQEAKEAASEDEYYEKLVNAVFALVKKPTQVKLKVEIDTYNNKDRNKCLVDSLEVPNMALGIDSNDEIPF